MAQDTLRDYLSHEMKDSHGFLCMQNYNKNPFFVFSCNEKTKNGLSFHHGSVY